MKNRAKCKLCASIIESYHATDLVLCKCGEISVDGGDALLCAAKDWVNFLRIDDQGNEIIPTIKTVIKQESAPEMPREKPSKDDLLKLLSEMIENIERLPKIALAQHVTHYDLLSTLLLLRELFRA